VDLLQVCFVCHSIYGCHSKFIRAITNVLFCWANAEIICSHPFLHFSHARSHFLKLQRLIGNSIDFVTLSYIHLSIKSFATASNRDNKLNKLFTFITRYQLLLIKDGRVLSRKIYQRTRLTLAQLYRPNGTFGDELPIGPSDRVLSLIGALGEDVLDC
jgi:hypothetical protein